MFNKILFTFILLGSSFFASASTTLSSNAPVLNTIPVVNSLFNDAFTFTVGANEKGSVSISNFPLLTTFPGFPGVFNVYNINNLTAATVSGAPLFNFIKEPNGTWQSTSVLAGAYSFDVTGKTSGLNGGIYSVIFSAIPVTAAAPVPVPAAVWLFGSALLGLTGLNRRKQSIV